MKVRPTTIAVCLLCLCIGAGGLTAAWRRPPLPAHNNDLRMRLRRTCLACPNYTITLLGNGELIYSGGDLALVPGTRLFKLDEAAVSAILSDFLQPQFLELDNSYPSPGTQKMTVSLLIEMNGLSKEVFSENAHGPTVLHDLEQRIDDLPGMRALSGWTH